MTPKTIARRTRTKDGGFTLVELMVVVMIIAILMAIAIPTFLNSRKKAQDSAAKSNVRNSLSAAQSVFSETQKYPATADMLIALRLEEPSLSFESTASTAPKVISVVTNATTATIVVSAWSASENCFAMRHIATAGGGTTQYKYDGATSAQCIATGPPATGVPLATDPWKLVT